MIAYDFSTLNDKEFEEFCRDLLNAVFDLKLQSFKPGKDKGVDLRLSSEGSANELVVQAKHYKSTPVSRLLYDLEHSELPKVKDLSPKTYWIATSLPLAAADKDKLVDLFDPYLPSANYVFGREDLNAHLSNHPALLQKWYKLWLSSTAVLQSILNNAVIGRSEFYKDKIIKRLSFYVATSALTEAQELIQEHKFLLITGQPGVGKTTLANLVAYQFLARNFQLIYVDKDVKEAEAFFDPDPYSLQLFYFDDFLGANYFDILHSRNSENTLVNFIERIQATTNKYLILTTRTTVYNLARQHYEQLNRSGLELVRKELQLKAYRVEEKALILYNHLFHSLLPETYKDEIFKDRNYWKIIQHSNYTPRLIEFFTTPFNAKPVAVSDYFAFVLKNLDHPEEVWRHSFVHQLSDEDRLLVSTVFSFSDHFFGTIELKPLEKGYAARLQNEVVRYGHKARHNSFRVALKNLLDGYLTSTHSIFTDQVELKFINPSISDFLLDYYRNSPEETWKVIEGALYYTQVRFCYKQLIAVEGRNTKTVQEETERFLDWVWARKNQLHHLPRRRILESETPSAEGQAIDLLRLLLDIREGKAVPNRVDTYLMELLQDLDFAQLNHTAFDELTRLFMSVAPSENIGLFLLERWDFNICQLFRLGANEEEYTTILDLFDHYGKDYAAFISVDDHREQVETAVEGLADDLTGDWVKDGLSEIRSEDDLDYLKSEVESKRKEIFRNFGLRHTCYDESYYFSDIDVSELIRKNRASHSEATESFVRPRREESPKLDIDDLFSR